MKLYNSNIDRIEQLQIIHTEDSTLYVDKIAEEQLNELGYYKVEYQGQPSRRYYSAVENRGIVGNKFIIGYTATEKPISEVREAMLIDLKEAFSGYSERPKVDTGLGYFVDGGRNDLTNFQIGKEFGFPAVKDANGDMQPITVEQYDTIITAIKAKGVSLYQVKWSKEDEIKALETVADCILYEATPYDYTVTQEDVDNDIDGTLTVGQILTRYKNKVKEWE